jgi:hypothetical protein
MKTIKVKVKWDFENTEFEHLRYSEAVVESNLPNTVTIEDYDEEEVEIESYLIDEYVFSPKSWKIIGDV